MRKFVRLVVIAVMFVLLSTLSRAVEDIEFKFEIPPLPYPPVFGDIQATDAMEGLTTFTVSVQIEASEQKKGVCYIGGSPVLPPDEPSNHIECDEVSAWKQEKHPDISPNPPNITKVLLYYYIKGDTSTTAAPIEMTYNSVTKLATADVPIDPSLKYKNPDGSFTGDSITFYIVALDHYGNVASQVPDTTMAPCVPGGASWEPSLSTPAWETCTSADVTQYEECSRVMDGTPTCSSSYTTNDRLNDTCGEPGSDGKQYLLTTQVPKTDIYGVQAGADADYFCIRMGLGAAPPPTSDSPPIEGYLAVFFNPDMPDANPGDTHIENAFAITYAPEAAGSDPTLVRVLWDVECISNPNTADPLGCKIKAAIPGDTDLSMGHANGALVFITKKSWGSNQLIGSSSKLAQIITLTGEINLSGDTLFWLVDMTNGLGFYHKNTTVEIKELTEVTPLAPSSASGECNLKGATGSGVKSCPKSQIKPPTGNDCIISFTPSINRSFVEKYKIYRATSDTAPGTVVTEIAENQTSATFSFTDTIAEADLDGYTRYYKLTSVNEQAVTPETPIANAKKTTCAPEDWEPPVAATIVACATPAGTTERLQVSWTADIVTDTSIKGFYILRDGTPVFDYPLGALTTNYTDVSSELVNGTQYTYSVRVVDNGDNLSPDATVNCAPEDREPPGKISSLLVTNKGTTLGAKMSWEASTESDTAGYNVYACKCAQNGDCDFDTNFTKLNGGSLLTSPSYENTSFFTEGQHCFYAEAVDDCDTSGSCPVTNSPNASGFPIGGCPGCGGSTYTKALWLTVEPDNCYPAFPTITTFTAVPLPEGGKCELSWAKVCGNSNPNGTDCLTSFTNCVSPDPEDIVGYEIISNNDGVATNIPYPYAAAPEQKRGIVVISPTPTKTVSGLTNNRSYCFLPYTIDGAGNYPSESTKPTGVCCTPADIEAPSEPEMSSILWDDTPSCTPAWKSITDSDTITFNLYRCDGDKTTCTSGTSFTAVDGGTGLSKTTLTKMDTSMVDVTTYTYAITAKDPSGNESGVVGTKNLIECGLGTVQTAQPPASANAAAINTNTGCKFWFTASPSDVAPYTTGEGYKIYLCTGTAATTCQATAISTRNACLSTADPGSYIQDVCDNSVTDYYEQAALLTAGKTGTWYAGVSYTDSTGESTKTVSTTSCLIEAPPPECTTATVEITTKAINEIDPTVVGTFTESPKTGVKIEVVDQSSGSVIASGATGADGIATIDVCPGDISGKTLRVQVRVDAANATGMFCDDTTSDCLLYLETDISGATVGTGYTLKKAAASLPKAGVAGRKEIGNANCDGIVDFDDFMELRNSYDAISGDAKYVAWADFNNSGAIDFDDFMVIRNNYDKAVFNPDGIVKTDANFCKQ